jgi:hypothetical protein
MEEAVMILAKTVLTLLLLLLLWRMWRPRDIW